MSKNEMSHLAESSPLVCGFRSYSADVKGTGLSKTRPIPESELEIERVIGFLSVPPADLHHLHIRRVKAARAHLLLPLKSHLAPVHIKKVYEQSTVHHKGDH